MYYSKYPIQTSEINVKKMFMLATTPLRRAQGRLLCSHRARGMGSAGATKPASSVLPVFPGLPQTVPLEGLPKPTMVRSALPGSGLRVASQETYGQLCNFGVFIDAGSRVEGVGVAGQRGATHLLELMAFKSTGKREPRTHTLLHRCSTRNKAAQAVNKFTAAFVLVARGMRRNPWLRLVAAASINSHPCANKPCGPTRPCTWPWRRWAAPRWPSARGTW